MIYHHNVLLLTFFLCMKQTFTFFSQFNFLNTHITKNSQIEQQVMDLND